MFSAIFNIFVFFKSFKTHLKFTLFHSRELCSVLWMAQAPPHCSLMRFHMDSQILTRTKYPHLTLPRKKENVKKEKYSFICIFFLHTVCIVYIARTRRHTRPHTHPHRTPCPHLSGPSLLSTQPNSIRHSFSLSPWCSGGAGRNWTKYPQIPPSLGSLSSFFQWNHH